MMIPNIQKLIVKINISSEQATGMIISQPNNTKEDLIITVCHIFEKFDDDITSISLESKFNHTKEFVVNRVLYKKSDNIINDVAIIYVNKLDWIKPDDNMYIPNNDYELINSKVELAGFPKKIDGIDIPFLPLNVTICAYADEANSKLMVNLDKLLEPENYLYEAVKGMSGCPMFFMQNNHFYFLGVQKSVPSKTISYNMLIVLHYKWYLDTIRRLYNVELPLCIQPADEEMYENKQKFKQFFLKAKHQSGTFFLNQINKNLFPDIKSEIGLKYFNNNRQEVTLITCLRDIWNNECNNSKGILITGEGGSGKTVSLLETCEYCLDNDIYSVYIPMHEIKLANDSSTVSPIKKYLTDYIWQGEESKLESFLNTLNKNAGNIPKPGLVLLLDGFNEVIQKNVKNIIDDVNVWSKKVNVQIVITSRYNFQRNNGWLPHLVNLEIQPLNKTQINEYLRSCNLSVPNENKSLMKLLETPILLTLYSNTEMQYINNKGIIALNWIKNKVNTGTIIWNFIQCQFIKVIYSSSDSVEILNYVFALENISVFIGRKMEQNSLFTINEDTFFQWLEESILYYKNLWQDDLSPRLKFISRNYACSYARWDSVRLYTILIQELHIFILSEDKTISLLHQQFRDFFSANYFIDILLNEKLPLQEWAKEPINYYVLNFISDLIEFSLVDSICEKLRNLTLDLEDYTVHNLFQLYRRKKKDTTGKINFCDMNFDQLDLRNTSLSGTKLSSPQKKASFRNAKISEFTIFPEGHFDSIYCLAYSPDGSRALSGSSDKTIREWDLLTGQCINILNGHSAYVETVAYSPDGKRALSGAYDGSIIEWNLEVGNIIKSFKGHEKAVYAVKYNFNGTKAISGSFDNMLKVWELETGKCIKSIKCSNFGIRFLDYSPDGTKAITGSYDKIVREWDLETGKCIHRLEGHKGAVRCVIYSADGKKVLSCSDDRTIREWDLNTEKCIHILKGHKSKVSTASYSINGTKVLSSSYDHTIIEWNLEAESCSRIIPGHNSSVYCAWYSPNGKKAISGSSDLSIKEWDIDNGEIITIFKGYYKWSSANETFFKRNKGLSYFNDDIRVWDFNKNRCVGIVEDLVQYGVNKYSLEFISFNEKEDKALIYHNNFYNNYLEEWDLKIRECIVKLDFENNKITAGCYSPNAKYSLVALSDNTIQEWNLETKKCIQVLKGHKAAVNTVIYSQYASIAYSCSDDKNIYEWNLETGNNSTIYKGKRKIKFIAFSLSEKIMISYSEDGTIYEWDMIKKRITKRIYNSDDQIVSIALSYDGNKMLSSSKNGIIKEWNLQTGKSENIITLTREKCPNIQYYSDETKLILTSDQAVIEIWDIKEKKCVWKSQYIPNMNIVNCDFTGSEFTSIELRDLVSNSGGIVEN